MNNTGDISPEIFNTIERYIRKEMSAEEALAFESSLKEDEILKQQVDEVRLLIIGVEEASLFSSIDKWHTELKAEKSGTVQMKGYPLKMAGGSFHRYTDQCGFIFFRQQK